MAVPGLSSQGVRDRSRAGATDENPYPGYEGYEYYDDTQYDRAESEDAPSGEDGGGESVAEASQDGAPQAEETPAAAADAEEKLKEIKIVVLPPSEGGKA